MVAARGFDLDPELVECPAQLVNDAVLVGAVLVLVWAAAARGLYARVSWFVVACVGCASYARTAAHWHCDHLPGYPVQHYVLSQLTAAFDAAVAVVAIAAARRRRPST